MDIPDYSLSYFYCDQTAAIKNYTQDYRDLPRPHSAITYIVSGVGEIISDDRRDRLRPGDLMFTPIGARYMQVWEHPYFVNHISCRFMFRKLPYPFAERRLFVQKLSGFEDTLPDFEYILKNQNNPHELLTIMAKFYSLCQRFAPRLEGCDLPLSDPLIQRAVEYIDSNCHRRISVEELAAMCYLSVPHFYSRFKRAMGCAPIAYKQRAAILRAQRMLIDDPALTISEVGRQAGFESDSYFRRAFRAAVGMSPSEYRTVGE